MPSHDADKMEEYLRREGTDPELSNELARTVIDVHHARYGITEWVDFSVRYAIAHELQRRFVIFPRGEESSNLDRAREISSEIHELRTIQKDLKDAFHHRELDGGVKAAFNHPLYLKCDERIAYLQEQLTILI